MLHSEELGESLNLLLRFQKEHNIKERDEREEWQISCLALADAPIEVDMQSDPGSNASGSSAGPPATPPSWLSQLTGNGSVAIATPAPKSAEGSP